ncbi:MAG: hypothetical protein INH41_23600 [Myxococcaceae bacterium]|nr:hypothetical protein [Myxococcaceae bacterium]MCA3015385.1 hypothetical protein [Myxococcaceae bacterium]
MHDKQCIAQWYRACGVRLLKVVVVRVDTGAIGIRVSFSTDKDIDVPMLLESDSGRWLIEVCFRDFDRLMDSADLSARTRHAVGRTAPFAGLSYSTIVLWALCSPHALVLALPAAPRGTAPSRASPSPTFSALRASRFRHGRFVIRDLNSRTYAIASMTLCRSSSRSD